MPLIPAWVPLLWSPVVVLERLGQLWRIAHALPPQWRADRCVEVLALARDLGIQPGRHEGVLEAVVACPRCGGLTPTLWATEGAWAGLCCIRTGILKAAPAPIRVLGRYACGLRMGAAGTRTMLLTRWWLLGHQGTWRAVHGVQRLAYVVALAQLVAPCLGPPRPVAPRWYYPGPGPAKGMAYQRRPPPQLRRAPGPLQEGLGKELIAAMVDSLLAPGAYLERFG